MERAFLSPAKVNLLLKVLSKRPDGYHDILSIVDLVSLYDVIYVEEEPSGAVVVKDDKGVLPIGEKNTIYRTAMLLKEEYGISKGVRIFIEKCIPIGSGLGGPSSNAATTLKALAGVWGLAIGEDELFGLGARIGADVPLFLYGKPCVMSGIGEKISSIVLPSLWYIIMYPDIVMSTPEVYSRVRIVLTKGENDIKLRRNFDSAYDVSRILENDLENVGILMCPTIKDIKDRLIEAGSLGALMSGSGSSVFGLFKGEEEARKAAGLLNGIGSVFIAHSI
ncbi:MAG: 4-(cytidine 5'-diphospho)-2-C-methyl-D-erythritol kinase [Syntrophus sp. (in: bacteria)]|nr:4-(cytidine 5'-diphospho)-2-C-methyl-D-erythritol kinase [Syntrophus sp. (in: bacteria)]